MSTLTIRLPAIKYQRLKDFARARGVSLIQYFPPPSVFKDA
jgi:hypothetical protein